MQVASARSQVQLTCEELKSPLHENRPSVGIGVVEVQKPMVFFAISKVPARPSAGMGVVEVQKPMVFFRFLKFPHDPLRGSAWSRCKNPCFFCDFCCSHDPLRGSAWSRCKNPWFSAISAVLARPSAGIGVVEVQKLGVFCDFCGARATLCGNRRGRGAKTRGFLRLLLFELVLGSCLVVRAPAPGTGGSRPGPRAGVARCNLHFKATWAEQLAQSKLHRATCADQLAPTSSRRAPCLATCTEQLAQSNLQGAQFAQSNLQGATCRDQLAGATCAEQFAQCNLRRATCADQLAPTSLRRAPCLVLSRACLTNASCREKERILQRWADFACDVLLSGQPWSSCCCWFCSF